MRGCTLNVGMLLLGQEGFSVACMDSTITYRYVLGMQLQVLTADCGCGQRILRWTLVSSQLHRQVIAKLSWLLMSIGSHEQDSLFSRHSQNVLGLQVH